MAFRTDAEPVAGIVRFHAALREMTGRRGIRNDVSRYEAMTIALLEVDGNRAGTVFAPFPPAESPLRLETFFATLYARYDERYVFSAPKLAKTTRRVAWSESSPAFRGELPTTCTPLDYEPRIATGPEVEEPEESED